MNCTAQPNTGPKYFPFSPLLFCSFVLDDKYVLEVKLNGVPAVKVKMQ